LEKIRQLIQFFREAAEELKKVSWLTRPQMMASTWLVILLVIVFSVFVGALDFVIAKSFHFSSPSERTPLWRVDGMSFIRILDMKIRSRRLLRKRRFSKAQRTDFSTFDPDGRRG
jgi:preprotein translocase SecE subunit